MLTEAEFAYDRRSAIVLPPSKWTDRKWAKVLKSHRCFFVTFFHDKINCIDTLNDVTLYQV